MTLRLGTRGSPLARRQADRVQRELAPGRGSRPVVIKSTGDRDQTSPLDRPEQVGVFTSALTEAVQAGEVDCAVHSLKDLPLGSPEGIGLVAILKRDDPADLLLVREPASDASAPLGLAAGSRVGSSAPRRQTQLLHADPTLVPVDIRGNIAKRLSLLERGVVDGLLMAAAALKRLEQPLPDGLRAHRLDPVRFPPAPGQAAIAVQAKTGSDAARILARLDDPETREAVMLERTVLAGLGGGCGLPLGSYVWREPETGWNLSATLAGADWRERVAPTLTVARLSGEKPQQLANDALARLQENNEEESPTHLLGRSNVLLTTFDEDAIMRYASPLAGIGWRPFAWPFIESETTGDRPPIVPGGPFWVAVTSARAVPFVNGLVERPDGGWRSFRIAANGPATAFALRRAGFPVHVVCEDATGKGLAAAIALFPADPAPVLWPAAQEPAGGLMQALRDHGFEVHHWPVYRTRPRRPLPSSPVDFPVDAFLVTSPSNVRALAANCVGDGVAVCWIAMGPTTEKALREAGYPVHAVVDRPSPAGIASLLLETERMQSHGREVRDEYAVNTIEKPLRGKTDEV